MALIAAHPNAGVILVVTAFIPPSPLLPVPNKPYGFCGRYALVYLLDHLLTKEHQSSGDV